MKNTGQKPSIFISSTVYDFRDLRSSLKYYLEELGYIVNMSEFNDFQREPDANSYEACLQTVRQADYFILLIGSRAGGPYTKDSGVTITQQEYRTAYEGAKAGRTRILTFVRGDVWTVKDDRDELIKLLKEQFVASDELPAAVADVKIAKHASKFVTNAEHIFSFIEEVRRTGEMRAALAGKGELPPANWVHQFGTFRDIVDCLRIQFNIEDNLERKILIENLKSELLGNLKIMLFRSNASGDVQMRTQPTDPFRGDCTLALSSSVQAKCKHVLWMLMGTITLDIPTPSLRFRMIERCIDLGIFLSFSSSTGQATQTIQHQLLEELRVAIDRYFSCNISKDLTILLKKYGHIAKSGGSDSLMNIDSNDFAGVVNMANILDEIFSLTKGLYLYLHGKDVDLEKIERFPRSPYPDHDKLLAEEIVSVEETMKHILTS